MITPSLRRRHAVARLALASITAALAACASTPSARHAAPANADRVADLLTGSFSSQKQAEIDPDYRDIRLHAARIWADRTDGPWLYVEQAAATALEKPYRQRVYHLVNVDGGSVRSDVFLLPGDPLRFAGACAEPARLNELTPKDLIPRDGCSIRLTPSATDSFAGGTEGASCASELAGAAYATSTAVLTPECLFTWDRGFDSSGTQVWGATKGPYRFVRQP